MNGPTLRDIHLPDAIGLWPLAPGYYLLLLALLFLLGITFYLFYKHLSHLHIKKQALKLLIQLEQDIPSTDHPKVCSEISALLKRIALVYYPRKIVAGLKGDEWIAFLNETGKPLDFNEVRFELVMLPFYPKGTAPKLDKLIMLSKQWVKKRRRYV